VLIEPCTSCFVLAYALFYVPCHFEQISTYVCMYAYLQCCRLCNALPTCASFHVHSSCRLGLISANYYIVIDEGFKTGQRTTYASSYRNGLPSQRV